MRNSLLALLIALFTLALAPAAYAADPAPGDACAANGEFMRVGGAESSGVGHFMVCESGSWKSLLSFDGSAQVGFGITMPADPLHVVGNIRIDNNTDGTNKGCIRFNGSTNKLEFSHDCTAFTDMGASGSDTLAGLSCSSGQVAKWNGTAWACAADNMGGGGGGSPVTVFLTSGTSWTVPADWNDADNTIEVIAGGGGGGGAVNIGGAGGGGGAYSKILNATLTPSSTVTIAVGSGGGVASPGGDTYFCNATSNCATIAGSAVVVGAKGGGAGGSNSTIGVGGAAASGIGTVKYSGGSGGTSASGSSDGGGGGGGAAGPGGNGKNGGNATGGTGDGGGGGGGAGGGTSTAGSNNSGDDGGPGGNGPAGSGAGAPPSGDGTNGGGGAGGSDNTAAELGGDGGAGTEWDATHGAGGGGGGGGGGAGGGIEPSGSGGLYGGGGGGAAVRGNGLAGPGAQGVIVITYTPAGTPTGDNLGDHTATQDLDLSANDILDAATVAIGIPTASDPLHVVGNIRVDNNTDGTNKGCIRFDGGTNKLQFSHDCTTFSDMGSGDASQWITSGSAIYYNSGNVSIGTTDVTYPYQFQNATVATSGNTIAQLRQYVVSPASDSGAQYIGDSNNVLTIGAANFTDSISASNSGALHMATGTLASAYGARNMARTIATGGDITNAYGTHSSVDNDDGGGVIGTAYGAYNEARNVSDTETLATAYGAYSITSLQGDAPAAITLAHGAYNRVWNSGSGLIANAYGSYNTAETSAAGGAIGSAYASHNRVSAGAGSTITNAVGVLAGLYNSGTVENWYGLYISPVNGTAPTTARYPIYSLDTGASYLAGNLNIGTGSGYLNFGGTDGTTGYGIRDNAGTIECKNSAGSWAACAGGAGDNLGNHTATQDLDLAANDILDAATVAIGIPTASDPLHVVGNVRIDNNTDGTNKGCIRFDGGTNKLQFSHDCSAYTDMGDGGSADNLGNHTATQDLDMATFKITGMGAPSAATDATTKGYVDGLTGANESDPQVGTLTEGKWCYVNGGVVDCTQNAPSGGGGGNDASPDQFTFTDQTNVAQSTLFDSNIVQILNFDVGALISAVNLTTGTLAEYRICADNACTSVLLDWGTGMGMIYNGQYVQLRLTSSANIETKTTVLLSINGVVDKWDVTTTYASCTLVGGNCWYLAVADASCDTVCATPASRSGYNAATLTYAGSGGTDVNCGAVLSALGAAGSGNSTPLPLSAGAGCLVLSSSRFRDTTATTSSGIYSTGARRACACNG